MISIIIPVYNEKGIIGRTIEHLKSVACSNQVKEIIVVDGGSIDGTVKEAKERGATVIESRSKGRAIQMNTGAKSAQGSVLYFLHADSIPPDSFPSDITNAINEGFTMGCYRLRFDEKHWFLKANSWFTRFDVNAFRFGDQSLFVTREAFDNSGGFCEKHIIMEDNEIFQRLRKHGNFIVLPKEVTTSARKYIRNGIFKMQGIFYLIFFMYKLGFSQENLLKTFRSLVHQDKL